MDDKEHGSCLWRITGGVLRPGGLAITDRALSLCPVRPGDRVLDAGCGCGMTLRHLRDRHGAKSYGLDLSMEMLTEARAEYDGGPLVRARMEAMPFGKSVFGGIVCECVLSHTDSEAVMREFSRIVRRGGFLALSDLYRLSGEASTVPGMEILDRDGILACLARSGFAIVSWEDRTADLKRLAAELIMSGCSLPPYYIAAGPVCDKGSFDWRGIGYYLLVARRTDGN